MTEIIVSNRASDLMAMAGAAANQAAAQSVFSEFTSRKAVNTLRRHTGDLATFADFLHAAHLPTGDLMNDPEAWRGVTWGIVEAFRGWMLQQGFAVSTINFRLSTVKVYARLATKAGALDQGNMAMIQMVQGYANKEIDNLDKNRKEKGLNTRRQVKSNGQRSTKKAEPINLTVDQARQLKSQPDTPQGRRDAVIMCILLDHGLRCGELALLQVEDIDLEARTIRFDRPKVHIKDQRHEMSPATHKALSAYLSKDHPLLTGPLLLASKKGGKRGAAGGQLAGSGMCERTITERVRYLGELIGIDGLSAHDCRHFGATYQAVVKRKGINELMDYGGWSSPAMPMRYVARAKVVKWD